MRIVIVVGLLLSAITLSGCAMNDDLPADPEARIAAVKKFTQEAERRTVDALPAGDVKSTKQLSTGSFLDCSGGVRWSGNLRATLASGVDAVSSQRKIAEAAEEAGFDVSKDKVSSGDDRVQIIDSHGVQLLVTIWDKGTVIDVLSGSPCFSLPDDYDLPYEY